jgi:hypothetical protein
MPSKTPKQARAMRAAASGRSTIGIPAKVGREFVKADTVKAHAQAKPKPSLADVFLKS